MSGHDEEFEAFLKRRRPLFRREVDDGLEPPAELDRIVLRQARQAIEDERPVRMFGMPRWAAPTAIAATLVLGVSIVFKAGMPPVTRVPEVTVENIAQRVEYPTPAEQARAAPMESEAEAATPGPDNGSIVVELAAPASANSAPTQSSPMMARGESNRVADTDARPAAKASAVAADAAQPWRQDVRAWQAEIERLRASGDAERANAEQAEFNRQHRAYAVSPDR